jgi:hypothetical protein
MSAELAPIFRRSYILGGEATITVVSKSTGTRYTYRIHAKEDAEQPSLHFVSVLVGAENTSDYTFLGTIFDGARYRHGKKSRISPEAPSAVAFAWLWDHLASTDVEVWHSGRGSRCGRTLTTPESIQAGIGPVCAGRV